MTRRAPAPRVKKNAPAATPGPPPAMRPESWPLDQIHPYPNNPRTHPQDQIELLAKLMTKHGIDQPIVVDEDGTILKGHGRRLAALKAGLAEFPVVVHRGLPPAEKTAMRIQDNQVSALSGWDPQLIRGELAVLKASGFAMPLLGFGDRQLTAWGVATPADTKDPDEIPPEPKRPIVKLGETWVLGSHRLAIGDATNPATWKALYGRERAAMVFTDPPYGVSYAARSGKFKVIKGDDKRRDDLYGMLVKALRETARYTTDRGALYIWHASTSREDFAQAMKAVGITERQYLIWVKPAIVLGHSDYRWQHEPCFYAAKGDQAPAFYGDRAGSTVWHASLVRPKETQTTVGSGVVLMDGQGDQLYIQTRAPKNKKLRQIRIDPKGSITLAGTHPAGTVWEVTRDHGAEHPTQKPVELARRAIENSSQPGEIIADGFLGSGTTLIAAEMTGRRCYGIELDPVYAEVIIRRWEKFAGAAAIRESTGQTFHDLSKRTSTAPTSAAPSPDAGDARRAKGPSRPKPFAPPSSGSAAAGRNPDSPA